MFARKRKDDVVGNVIFAGVRSKTKRILESKKYANGTAIAREELARREAISRRQMEDTRDQWGQWGEDWGFENGSELSESEFEEDSGDNADDEGQDSDHELHAMSRVYEDVYEGMMSDSDGETAKAIRRNTRWRHKVKRQDKRKASSLNNKRNWKIFVEIAARSTAIQSPDAENWCHCGFRIKEMPVVKLNGTFDV
jgi:hypothetical protein